VLAASGGNDEPEEVAPVNLIPNADFEETTDGKPTGWSDLRTYQGAGADKIEVSSSPNGRTGKCLKVTATEDTDSGVAISIPIKKGMRYRLSGWIKTENLTTRRNAPGALLNLHGGQRTNSVRGTKDWTEVSVEFESGADREALIHCLFSAYGLGQGTVYFDDISLTPMSSANNLAGALANLKKFVQSGGEPAKPIVRKFKPDPKVHKRGLAVFNLTCAACHGVDGKGVPETFPPLDGAAWVIGDPERATKIVLHGLMGELEVKGHTYNNVMAPLGAALNDQQIADVLTYVRQNWSNDASPVSEEQVSKVRKGTAARKTMYQPPELKE
jgi:mono/diheme cytochrome c family protein